MTDVLLVDEQQERSPCIEAAPGRGCLAKIR